MRAGGRLDGFPLHLLTGGRGDAVTLVLDDVDLGRLQLRPVPGGGGMLLAVARSARLLRETRRQARAAGLAGVHAVCADPERLPFRAGALHGALTGPGGWPGSPEPLAEGAWLARWLPPCGGASGRHRSGGPERLYTVRPAAGPEYFVTRRWLPSPWPFRALQLGRLRSLRLGVARALARIPLPWIQDAVQIAVTPGSGSQAELPELAPERFGLFVKAHWNALLLGLEGPRRIVKFPLIDVASRRMASHAHALEALAGDAVGPLDAFLPRLLERGRRGGQEYWTEALFEGMPSTRWRPRPAWRREVAEQGFAFLLELHRQTATPTRISRDLFDGLCKPRLARVGAEARRLDPRFDASRLSAALWSRLGERRIPLVRTHGDYWAGNVLVSRDGRLTGVLDWDASAERGWPLLDLLHFLAFQHKRRAFWHFGAVVGDRLLPARLAGWEREIAGRYCAGLGLEGALWPAFVALYWLERAAQWLETDFHEGKRNEAWLRRNVLDACPRLVAALEAPASPPASGADRPAP